MKRVVITGASGWLGSAMIAMLIKKYGNSILNSVELYGSKNGILELDSQKKLDIKSLDSFNTKGEIDLFIPMAFLTQEKYEYLGSQEYKTINKNIISKHTEIINRSDVKSCISLSSGIVSLTNSDVVRPRSFWEYRSLKQEEESAMLVACSNRQTALISCRLFSLSGRHMKDPLKYALGDFISQAVKNKFIKIRSNYPVLRKYVSDENLCTLLLLLAERMETMNLESSGSLVELEELAQLVARKLGLKNEIVQRTKRTSFEPDSYFSKSEKMEMLATECGLYFQDLEQQVIGTTRGLIAAGLV